MTDPNEWIKNLIPPEDVAQIESSAKKIIKEDTTIYEMSILMTQSDMVQAVRAAVGMQVGDTESWMVGISILMALVSTMEQALDADGVDVFEEE